MTYTATYHGTSTSDDDDDDGDDNDSIMKATMTAAVWIFSTYTASAYHLYTSIRKRAISTRQYLLYLLYTVCAYLFDGSTAKKKRTEKRENTILAKSTGKEIIELNK